MSRKVTSSLAGRRLLLATATVLCTALVAGCGSTRWGFPYRTDIQQGNWVTTEQIAQLAPGMSREQVRFLLGSPTLQDVFREDRWDYPYYNKPGYGSPQARRFSVWFDGNSLVRWEGDPQPDRQPFQSADTGMGSTAEKDAPAVETVESTSSSASPSTNNPLP